MTLNYQNIIVAIDGSRASDKAFKRSLDIVRDNQSRLILTHVIDSRIFYSAGNYDKVLAEQTEENANELIERYVQQATSAGIHPLEKCIEFGSPKVKIAKEIAQDFDADLIICGATGLNAVQRFLIGSVSESIMRNASCDVLIVR